MWRKSFLHYCFICFFILTCNGAVAQVENIIQSADCQPSAYVHLLKNKKVALIINQASKAGDSLLLDILLARGIKVTKIFVPEHGFRGKEDAGAHIDNSVDSATGIPVISLYGSHKKPTKADLEGIDIMVYDLQDVGARFYTYISTLQYCMEACAEEKKQFLVLDRPNPNGFYVDGPVLDTQFRSFVGMQPIPIVYGMTAGEYAQMLVGENWFNNAGALNLVVIKCFNYNHKMRYLLSVAPSPNLRTKAAIEWYPSLCLFEGTKISVGRGTEFPFEQFGAPELQGHFSYTFTPISSAGAKSPTYEKKTCYGERLYDFAVGEKGLGSGKIQLNYLIKAYEAYPDKEKFFNPFFIKLCGTNQLEEQIKSGKTEDEIKQTWQEGLTQFKKIRKKYLLYKDFE